MLQKVSMDGGGGWKVPHTGNYLQCHHSETGVMSFRFSVWDCGISGVRFGHFCTSVHGITGCDVMEFFWVLKFYYRFNMTAP